MQKIFFIFLFFLISLGIGLIWIAKETRYQNPNLTVVDFEKGQSLRSFAKALQEKKIISNAVLFEILIRLQKKDRLLHSGEYEFSKGIIMGKIIDMVVDGKVRLYPFTIPEGYNLKETGQIILKANLSGKEDWAKLVKDGTKLKNLGINPPTLEGFLFPDTYFLEKKTTTAELADKMLALFETKIDLPLRNQAKQKNLSLFEWVTLASVIEKETGAPSERPLIASVFLNRLKLGMPLQSDPTVIYGIPNFNGNLTRVHLQTDTPYNTYTRIGLPVGPICSPGMASLLAVLNPILSDYLYFVSKGDGTHYFSKTLEEHNRAVNYYQMKKGNPP